MSALAGLYRAGVSKPVRYAAEFIAAAGITNATQRQALYQLESELLAGGLLDRYARAACRLPAWWPAVGGTAFAHQFNFVDPSAYALQFYGSPAHSNTGGIAWNGVNQYADTDFRLDAYTMQQGGGLHYYSLSEPGTTSDAIEIGTLEGGEGFYLAVKTPNLGNVAVAHATGSNITSPAASTGKGLYSAVYENTGTTSLYVNGATAATGSGTGIAPSKTVYLGALHFAGQTNDLYGFSNRACGGAGISLGLTAAENAALYAAVQHFNTTLSRAV